MSDSRERFEAWCAIDGINAEREDSGVYAYASARIAWRSWQAAERDALERAAQVCEEVLPGYEWVFAKKSVKQICADAIRALAGKE